MAQRTVSKPEYKEIVKKYNLLCGAHQLWELWQDSMTMYALAISNAVDGRFREQREKAYVDIAHKYTKEEMQVFPQILGEIVMQLEAKPEQDLLGDLYMQLDLGSHWHGQFFTPYNICAMMAHTQLGQQEYTLENVEPITVCDCACGGGALLIAAAHEFRKAIKHTGLNAQHYICLYAQDLSQVSAMMCYVQLSLLGYAAYVICTKQGKQTTSRTVSGFLRRSAYKYGIPVEVMHPHAFRHYFAMEFIKRKNDIALLADLLGHGSVNVTQIYLRQSQEQQKAVVDSVVNW